MVTLVSPDDLTRGAIHPGQTIEPQPDQDPVDGRRRNAETVANAARAEFELCAQLGNLCLDLPRSLTGGAPGPAGAVDQPINTLLAEPPPPLVAGGPRDPHLGCHMGDGSALFNAPTERQSANRGESGVSVHLSLLGS